MDEKKQEKNAALLLFLSDYKPTNSSKTVYRFVNGDEYEGMQTNDAPVECLSRMALTQLAGLEGLEPNQKIKLEPDKKLYVLCITSYKVMTVEVEEKKTAWTNFQDTLKKLQEKYLGKDDACKRDLFEIIPIPYDYRDEGNRCTPFSDRDEDTNQMAQRIFGDISDKLQTKEISDIYVDYTGGMRDIAFLMTTIIRYLEFDGINCQKVVYSQYDRNNTEHNRIRDITYIYEMFQMINGVNEFVTTGHATALNEAFQSKRNKAGNGEEKEEHEEVKILLENMVAFSNAMSICDVSKIDEYLKAISDSINKLKTNSMHNDSEGNHLEDTKNSDHQDLKVAMLKQLLDLMREKMHLDDLGQKDYYLKLIKWCVENNMLQQALTLIEDKMPGVYFDTKMLTYELDSAEKAKFTALEFVPNYEDRDTNIIFNYITRFWAKNPLSKFNDKRNSDVNKIKNASGGIQSVLTQLGENLISLNKGYQEDQSHENGFMNSYCEFRRLQDKAEKKTVNYDRKDFYPSDYFSVLKWCVDSETGYEYIKSNIVQETVNMSLKMHGKIKNNQSKQKYLEQTFLLHSALKKERNCCNHASDNGIRLPADVVKRAIEIYVKRMEEILEFIK